MVGKCMDEETQKTRKRLKGIWSVEEFNDLLERTMLSTEEKTNTNIVLQRTKDIDIHCRLSWNVRNNCQKKT